MTLNDIGLDRWHTGGLFQFKIVQFKNRKLLTNKKSQIILDFEKSEPKIQ